MKVRITNRKDWFGDRMKNMKIWVGKKFPSTTKVEYTGGALLGTFKGPGTNGQVVEITSSAKTKEDVVKGTLVVVQMETDYINLSEIEVFGLPVLDTESTSNTINTIMTKTTSTSKATSTTTTSASTTKTEVEVRLTSYPKGRVELYKNGKWGTLCGHYWWDNQKGAENICKQLGYTGGTKYTAPGGTGPIQTGNRLCKGGEATIWDCPLKRGELDGCTHDIDQGVACTGTRVGFGGPKDTSYCTASAPCKLGQGDCDSDKECIGSLVCGTDNCQNFTAQALNDADCCTNPGPGRCIDTGCKKMGLGEDMEAECVYLKNVNWSSISHIYNVSTPWKEGLCKGPDFDEDCCKCLPRLPVGCVDIKDACKDAFGGLGVCKNFVKDDMSAIDFEQGSKKNLCNVDKPDCCECFSLKKIKTTKP